MNDLDLQSGDIEGAYLTVPYRERMWTQVGSKFGPNKGKVYIAVSALYGLKSSGATFQTFLAEQLDDMGFKPTNIDPDVWIRSAVKHDGEEYYEYTLVYVDDTLAVSCDATSVMLEIAEKFKLKKMK